MRTEWAEAGTWSRSLFVIAAIYWAAMFVLFALSLPVARNGYEVGLVFGFYFVPLAYALLIRVGYALLSRRRPRPRIRSWWVLVVGALLGLLITAARLPAVL
jgi:drug/metabolite transporter (DMT)-like permease